MKRVLIVDDERYVLERLKGIINWEENGFIIVGQAMNGQEALGVITSNNIDLLIADINMPIINGLELCEILKNKYQNIQLVLLTGYSEFEYVQKALRYNVSDYLTKPIQANELLTCLARVKEKLENNEADKEYKEMLISKASEYKKQSRQSALLLYVSGAITVRQLLEEYGVTDFFNGVSQLYCAIIERYMQGESKSKEQSVDKKTIVQMLKSITEKIEILTEKDKCTIVFNSERDKETIFHAFRQLSNELENGTHIGVGLCVDSVSEIVSSYKTAKYGVFCSKSSQINDNVKMYQEINHAEIQQTLSIFETKHYFKSKNIDAITQCMQKEFQQAIENQVGYQEFERYFYKYINALQDIANDYNIKLEQDNLKIYTFEEILNTFQTVDELVVYMQLSFKKLMEEVENTGDRAKFSDMIARVIRYIEKNYTEPKLTLRKIAEDNYISYSYLSNIFKKQTNQSVIDYINDFRINKAKELLVEGSLNIFQVAEQVGFQDTKYFSKCFRKRVGVSPRDYIKVEQ